MKSSLSILIASVCLALGIAPALAQDKYPSRPIKILVPYAPGGATDIVARVLGDRLRDRSGHPSWSRTSPAPTASSRSRRWRARRPTATR